MSAFRDAIEAEINAIFLNLDEFGKIVNFNGRRIQAVVETFDVDFDGSRAGVSLEGVTLYAAERDICEELIAGKEAFLNGERWYVFSAERDSCLRIVRLYRELS